MSTINSLLDRLRRADRIHQREQGGGWLLRCVKWLCAAVVGGFALDVVLHLPPGPRVLLGTGFVLAVVVLAVRAWWIACRRRNQLEHVARLLEARDPVLGSKLINALQLQAQTGDPALSPLTRELAGQAVSVYGAQLAGIDFERLARTPRLRVEFRRALVAALLLGVVLGATHRMTRVEVARFVDPYGDHPPYSFTQLEIVQPGETGTNVVYGQPAEIRVRHSGHRPRELFLTWHPAGRPDLTNTVPMIDQGGSMFRQEIPALRSNLVVHAHTRDRHSLSRRRLLTVLLTPRLQQAWVRIAPPSYTRLAAVERPYDFKSIQALTGSEVRFRLQSNRPLAGGDLEFITDRATNRIELKTVAADEVAGALMARESGRLRFRLVDVAGLVSTDPIEGSFTVTRDVAPEVTIAEPVRDSVVAMDYKLEVQVEASDDYGLSQLRIHQAVNGVFRPPVRVDLDTNVVLRRLRHPLPVDFAALGAKPDDEISVFAEAIDTAPEPNLSRSQTVRIRLISVEDYNQLLREQMDIADAQAKFDQLISQLAQRVEEQEQLAREAANLQAAAERDPAKAAGLAPQLDLLLARQQQVNQQLNDLAARMETAVRPDPVYDIEAGFQETLQEKARAIRASTTANQSTNAAVARRSSPPGGSREVSPPLAGEFAAAAREQARRLGGMSQELSRDISEPLADLVPLQELLKDFNQFEHLFRAQEQLASQTAAYNRDTPLNREEQLALKDIAGTEKEVGAMLEALEQRLRENARSAEKNFPKAAQSARDLADRLEEARLGALARNATREMLAGRGDQSHQAAERLRAEMEKLFSTCQGGNCPSPSELDGFLSLNRGPKPGRSFAQMSRSRKFGVPGRGQVGGQGDGISGTTGYAVSQQPPLDVLGNESRVERSTRAGRTSPRRSEGIGAATAAAEGLVASPTASVPGLNALNRQSGVVNAESTPEAYRHLVDEYFRTLTREKKQP